MCTLVFGPQSPPRPRKEGEGCKFRCNFPVRAFAALCAFSVYFAFKCARLFLDRKARQGPAKKAKVVNSDATFPYVPLRPFAPSLRTLRLNVHACFWTAKPAKAPQRRRRL